MNQVGINFQANAPVHTGRPTQPDQGGYQIIGLLLAVAGQVSHGVSQGAMYEGFGQASGAFAGMGGYLGQGGAHFGQAGFAGGFGGGFAGGVTGGFGGFAGGFAGYGLVGQGGAGATQGFGGHGVFGNYGVSTQQRFQNGYQELASQFQGPQHSQQHQLQAQIKMLLAFLLQGAFQGGNICTCRHGHGGHAHPHDAKPKAPAPDVKNSVGNPKDWYFKHGKYKKEDTAKGQVMFDANTRIEYNKDTKTGQVYKKVNGDWQLDEVRTDWGGKAASPIILDMDGDGKADVAGGEWKPHAEKGDIGAHKVRFDLDGDGHKELTEWTGGKDGLFLKLNDQQVQAYQNTGRLEVSGKELYGDEGGKYKDGYAKMQALSDINRDGQLSGQELNKHYVWQDENRDGVVDQGELKNAQDAGITKVQATHSGNFQSAFEMNGETRKSWDWWPTTWN